MSEAELQKQVVAWLRYAAPDCLFYHPANGEARSPITGAKLKAMGVLAGTPDLAFVLPGGRAAFIELKTDKGRLQDSQKRFQAACDELQTPYAICRSLPEVQGTLAAWGILNGRAAA